MSAEFDRMMSDIEASAEALVRQRDDALGKLAAAVKLCEAKDMYIRKLEADWGRMNQELMKLKERGPAEGTAARTAQRAVPTNETKG